LRPWRDDGVESFRELHQSPDVMAFLPGPNSFEETRALVTRVRDHWARHGYGLFVLEKRETRRFLGFTGLIAIEWEAPVRGVEIGWRLRRDAWGRASPRKRRKGCLPLAFDTLGVDPLVAIAVPETVRSHRVMERLRFERRPEKDFDHPRIAAGHRLAYHWAWELTRDRWLKAGRSSSR
jgi:RimJ/RimL family protein N-acetyltransferase